MPVTGDDRETRDLIIDLRGKVENLRSTVVKSEHDTRTEIERLRVEMQASRSEFRDDISRRLTTCDAKIDREISEMRELLKLKADKDIVEPMRRNMNTVAMFVITTIIGALIALIVVNHSTVPEIPHSIGQGK
jgi:lipoate-protein ligase A